MSKKMVYGLILLQPWLDLLTAWVIHQTDWPVSPGLVVRGLCLLIMWFYLLRRHRFYGVLIMGLLLWRRGRLIKYAYWAILLLGLGDLWMVWQPQRQTLLKILSCDLLVISWAIILPCLFQVDYASYGQTIYQGSVGWFYAANEIGAILAMLFPFSFVWLVTWQWRWFWLTGLSGLGAMLLLGTKTALLAMLGTEGLFLLFYLRQKKPREACALLLCLSCLVLPLAPALANVRQSIAAPPVSESEQTDWVNVAFSGRQNRLQENWASYQSAGLGQKLWGQASALPLELDGCDLLFYVGIWGLVVLFYPAWQHLSGTLRRQEVQPLWALTYTIAIGLGFSIAFLAGHVLSAPAVSGYLALLIVMASWHSDRQIKDDQMTILALHLGYGGVERYLASLCQMLADDVQIKLIVTYRLFEQPAFAIDERVQVTYLCASGPQKEEASLSALWHNVCLLVQRKYRLIAVLRHTDSRYLLTTRPLHSRLAGQYASLQTIKMATEHNDLTQQPLYTLQLKRALRHFDAFVTVSRKLQQFYSGIFPGLEVVWIPNVLDRLPERISHTQQPVILHVGRLAAEKGQRDLLEVADLIHQAGWDFRLYIIGDGPLRSTLRQMIVQKDLVDHVILTGFLSPQEMEPYFLNSRVFVMTSLQESFGLAMLEAMSYGLPCFAFDDAAGLKVLLEKGGGKLIAARNCQEMAEAIIALFRDDALHDQLARQARQRSQDYLASHVVGQWRALLARLQAERLRSGF